MSEVNLESIDDLEAMLADLDGIDEAALEVIEKKREEPVAEVVTQAVTEPVVDDLDALLGDLDDLGDLEVVAEAEPVVEAVSEPEPVKVEEPEPEVEALTEAVADFDDEVEAMLEAASAEPTPEPEPEPKKEDLSTFFGSAGLRTFIDPNQLREDLNFTHTNISAAMTRQASLFAHYSTLSAQAQFQADRADQQVDLIEAQLDQQYRDSLAATGVKITENVVKAAITKDPKYQSALTRKHEAKAIADMVKSAADSFRHRRDMLIQVGADLREEAKGKLQTREHPGVKALSSM